MSSKWVILYAKRGPKKRKTFHDGFLVISANKIILSDETGKTLDSRILRRNETVDIGGQLELDKFVVQVESLCDAFPSTSKNSPIQKKRRMFMRNPSEVAQKLCPPPRQAHSSLISDISSSFESERNLDAILSIRFRFPAIAGLSQRKVVIPDRFKDLSEYKSVMSSAVIEEINLVVADFACRFKAAKARLDEQGGQNLSPEEHEQAYNQCDINFFAICELLVKSSSKPGYMAIRLGRNGAPLNYCKGDVMVISSSMSFDEKYSVVTTTESYGSSRSSVLELRLHGEWLSLFENKKVYAIQGPNIFSELSMLDCIRKMDTSSTPLLPLLIGTRKYVPREITLTADMDLAAKAAVLKYKLNDDQAQVLHRASQWFTQDGHQSPDICLVHGPFGSGKSHLLVALIIFLSDVLKEKGDSTTRFIIASATNSAVDRVLTGLLSCGFTDFIRVGSLSKIASNILPYSIHSKSAKLDETERDLRDLIRNSFGNEKLEIEKELKSIKDGKLNERRRKLQMVRVIGVTCSSASNEVLEGNTFKVCFLDECSQILEPLSLMPICKFRCEKLIAVGDPEQLPPVLCRSATQAFENDRECKNLSRTLFARLAALGHKPVLLRLQYRCHPRLARVPNRLFYGGELLDGCSEIERSPRIGGLAPLLFCDTRKEGKESRDASGSYFNVYEAEKICTIIKALIAKGISGWQIGVIALYKSQETCIRQMLYMGSHMTSKTKAACELEDVKVSTVDAFQGLEKDIILLSCCRTSGLGFLSSRNRLNVALTRAKYHLIIIGSASNLQRNPLWEELLENVRRKQNTFKTTEEMTEELLSQSTEDQMGWKSEEPLVQLSPAALLGKVPPSLMFETELTDRDVADWCRMKQVLDVVNFSPRDFWEGYKIYCFGHYSRSEHYQHEFSQTLMADVIRKVHNQVEFHWDRKFDALVRSSWCMMEDYCKQRHGVDCGDIRVLLQEYDDPERLAASEVGSILLQVCENDEGALKSGEKQEAGRRRRRRRSVVDNILGQLNSMDARLTKLVSNDEMRPSPSAPTDSYPSFDLGVEV